MIAALAAAALAVAACGPVDDAPQPKVYPDAVQRRIATLPNPTWRVAPGAGRADRALDDDRAGDATVGDGGGGGRARRRRLPAGTGTALHDARVPEGHGAGDAAGGGAWGRRPTRPRPGRAPPPTSRLRAGSRLGTARQGVLFLRTAHPTNAPVESEATDATVAAGALAFTVSNPDQSPWAYSVDTLSRAWLPAENIPAEGEAPTAFITDGTQTPPPTITLADLRAQIAALVAGLKSGEAIAGYAECIERRILHARHRRANPWTSSQSAATVASGSAAGTEVYRETRAYDEPRYDRFWLSGPDAALLRSLIVDDDDQPNTGYDNRLATTRPAAGRHLSLAPQLAAFLANPLQLRSRRHLPRLDDYGHGADGDGARGVLRSGGAGAAAWSDGTRRTGCWRRRPVGVAGDAAAAAASRGASGASTTAASLRRLTWDAGQLRLDVAGTTLAGPAVGADPPGRHGGADAARRRGHAHGHGRRPRAALAGLYATLAAGRAPDAADQRGSGGRPRRRPRAAPARRPCPR